MPCPFLLTASSVIPNTGAMLRYAMQCNDMPRHAMQCNDPPIPKSAMLTQPRMSGCSPTAPPSQPIIGAQISRLCFFGMNALLSGFFGRGGGGALGRCCPPLAVALGSFLVAVFALFAGVSAVVVGTLL